MTFAFLFSVVRKYNGMCGTRVDENYHRIRLSV